MSRRPSLDRRTILSWLGALLLFAFWLRYSFSVQGYENDFFWQLKVGLLSLQTHHLNNHDLFSWTAYHKPWLNQEWLGQIFLAGLFKIGSFPLVKLGWWFMLVLQFVMIGWIFIRAKVSPFLSAFFALVVCLLLGEINMTPRMQEFSLLGLSITAIVLQRWQLERSLGRWRYAYPLIVVLWANLHGGGAIGGPASLSLVLAIEALLSVRQKNWQALKPLLGTTLLSWLALLINPHTFQLIVYSFASLWDPDVQAMQKIILEWQPFSWALRDSGIYLAWAIAEILALIASRRKVSKLPMLAFAIAWAIMGIHAIRFLPFAMIASTPLLASLAKEEGWLDIGRRRIAAQTAIVALFSWILLFPRLQQLQQGAIFDGNSFPSVQSLEALKADASHSRLFNLYDWGGFLIYTLYPDVKVFIDGRQYLYGAKLNEDHQVLKHALPGWQAALKAYRIDAVFVPPYVELAAALRTLPGWHMAYADPTAVLFLKNASPRP